MLYVRAIFVETSFESIALTHKTTRDVRFSAKNLLMFIDMVAGFSSVSFGANNIEEKKVSFKRSNYVAISLDISRDYPVGITI